MPARANVTGRQFIEELMSVGRYTFTTKDAMERMGSSRDAAAAAVRRLRDKGAVGSPVRGFWVIVPPEYRSLGCLPAEQFVPELMEFTGQPYYAGLLTAASYHGAAHQRPQTFQVMTDRPRRAVECGRVRIAFVVRSDAAEMPIVERNTETGILRVSSPESTALDVVGYQDRCAGLDNVATILSELGEVLRAEQLVDVASKHGPYSWAQRLGYLLDLVGHERLTAPLADWVRENATQVAPLLHTEEGMAGARRDRKWKVAINVDVEPDV